MPAKQILLPATELDANTLESTLAVLMVRKFLSRNQIKTITMACASFLPCVIEMQQRMPKGTTYISINGAPAFEVNVRAKLQLVRENT